MLRLIIFLCGVFGFASNSFAALSVEVQAVVDAADIGGLSSAFSYLLAGAMAIVLIFVAYHIVVRALHKLGEGFAEESDGEKMSRAYWEERDANERDYRD